MKRKPGGQPNNKNAFKHGIYTPFFSPFECRALSEIPPTDLSGEIGLLRINVDRFMQSYAASLDKLDYENRLAGLRAITLAVGRIAALQRILSTASRESSEADQIKKKIMELPVDETSSRPAPGNHDQES